MKNSTVLFAIFIAVLITLTSLLTVGHALGVTYENTRLYEKCLAERESMPYKEVVLLCKEKVK
jgi:hypothetical protein